MRSAPSAALALWALIGWAGQPDAGAAILINEVLADPAGDANRDGEVHTTRDEFVELVNTADGPVSIAGWSVSDLVQVRHVFADADSVPPLGFFVVFGGGAPQGFSHAAVASSGSLGLNNTGDTLTLRGADAMLMDAFVYGSEGGQDASLARSPDATGPFALHPGVNGLAFSPGATVDGLARLPGSSEPDPPGDPDPEPPGDPDPPDDPGFPADPDPPIGPWPPSDPDPGFPGRSGPPGGPAVPEPSSIALMGLGLLGLPRLRRR